MPGAKLPFASPRELAVAELRRICATLQMDCAAVVFWDSRGNNWGISVGGAPPEVVLRALEAAVEAEGRQPGCLSAGSTH